MKAEQASVADFAEALRCAYLSNPAGVLPNALWKTLVEIQSCHRHISGGVASPTELALWDEERLLVSWSADGSPAEPVRKALDHVQLALLHKKTMPHCGTERFKKRDAHTRLHHSLLGLDTPLLPKDLIAVPATVPDEVAEVSAFIAGCYKNMTPAPEDVLGWMEHPVFAPELWVWIRHRQTQRDLALGIAEHDRRIGEVSLEWIQVHPDSRRRGIGRLLVCEILRRASQDGRFATVSGRSGSAAESLYRSCGFLDASIWWCLREG